MNHMRVDGVCSNHPQTVCESPIAKPPPNKSCWHTHIINSSRLLSFNIYLRDITNEYTCNKKRWSTGGFRKHKIHGKRDKGADNAEVTLSKKNIWTLIRADYLGPTNFDSTSINIIKVILYTLTPGVMKKRI